MPGSRDPGVTIVNPTEISVMHRLRNMTNDGGMYGSEGVKDQM